MSCAEWRCLACIGLLAAGCAPAAPYYVEQPLARLTATPNDAPPEAHVDAARLPITSEQTLHNGMKLYVVERPGSGLFTLYYTTRRARDDVEFLPVFVADALTAGTQSSDGSVIYPVLLCGQPPSTHTTAEGTTIGVTCTARHFDEVLERTADLVQRPLFEPKWLTQVLSAEQESLARIRSRYWQWSVVSEHSGSPFEVDPEQIAKQLRAVDHAALTRAHRELFGPRDSALVVVGDISAAHVLAAAGAQFGSWGDFLPTPAPPTTSAQTAPKAEARAGRQLLVFERQREKTSLFVVQNAPSADSPDAAPFELLSLILGGNSKSGLLDSLRYRRAHVYAAQAELVPVPTRGRFLVLETTVSERTLSEDLSVMLHRLAELRTTPLDQAEIDGAKARFNAGLATSLAFSRGLASYLALAEIGRVPRLDEERTRFDRTSAADIQRVAQRYLDPDRATIVIDGTVSSLMPDLRRFGDVSER
ncbi:MAG: insulinase family protein [Pseudomonadota bacterium]